MRLNVQYKPKLSVSLATLEKKDFVHWTTKVTIKGLFTIEELKTLEMSRAYLTAATLSRLDFLKSF